MEYSKNKKILIILEGGKTFPSGITRGYVYSDLLKKSGIQYRFISRQSETLLKMMQRAPFFLRFFNQGWISLILFHLNRVVTFLKSRYILLIADGYEVIYTSKVLDFDLLHKLKFEKNKKIVYDFGDSVWLYKSVPQFKNILSIADVVTTDNIYVLDYIKKININSFVIPDYPQIDLFDRYRKKLVKKNNKIIIGWIGSPSTVFNLYLIWDVLHSLFEENRNIHLRLVGVGNNTNIFPDYNYIDYSTCPNYNQEEMVREVLNMDIGLFPLQDIEASKVRGILKSTIYMSGEVPVVCSPIGELNNFIIDGVNGFFAKDKEEWKMKLNFLINDKSLREKIGANGLESVRQGFSLSENFNKLLQAFNS